MATQLRAVVDNTIAISQINLGLDGLRHDLIGALPEAEEVNFAFTGARGLVVEVKTNKRELRDQIMFKLQNGLVPDLSFDKIVEGVETGARRRLTVTAEVR